MIHESHGVVETVKAAPAVAYGTAVLGGVGIADWVTYLTALYLILQLVLLIPKYLDWYRSWRLKCRSKQDSSNSE